MATIFKRTFELTDEDKKQVSEMTGKMVVWMLEGRSIGYMAEQLKIEPKAVECNIEEMLYTLRKQVGIWRYLKVLFRK